MQVTLELIGSLRKYLAEGQTKTTLDVPEGTTVREAVRVAGVPSGQTWNASVGGELVYEETELRRRDRLVVFPPIAGG